MSVFATLKIPIRKNTRLNMFTKLVADNCEVGYIVDACLRIENWRLYITEKEKKSLKYYIYTSYMLEQKSIIDIVPMISGLF